MPCLGTYIWRTHSTWKAEQPMPPPSNCVSPFTTSRLLSCQYTHIQFRNGLKREQFWLQKDDTKITRSTNALTLTLVVSDVDEYEPRQQLPVYYTNVKQSDQNVIVYDFDVMDIDPSVTHSDVTYATTSAHYTIGATDGVVRVIDKSAMPVDASNCPLDDEILVTADAGGGGDIVTMSLYIRAVPEDLTTPVFSPALADIGPILEEQNPVGSILHTVTVEDPDCKLYGAEGVRFELTYDRIDCCFIVPGTASNGQVSADIILKKELDYETMGSSFDLTVKAFNVLTPKEASSQVSDIFTVFIADAKDLYPRCPKALTAFIDEIPAVAGTVVVSIPCESQSSLTYTYTLTHPMFHMNGANLEITMDASLDYEVTRGYSLIVGVEVGGDSFVQDVHIEVDVQPVDDNSPAWTGPQTLSRSEATTPGATLATYTITDLDLGNVGNIKRSSIALVDNFVDTFELLVEQSALATSFDVQLILAKPLDAETQSLFLLELTANDGFATVLHPISLAVSDVAEFPPSCGQSSLLITIKEPVFSPKNLSAPLDCQANDVSQTVTFSRISGDNRFTVDSATGLITLSSNVKH